MPERLLSSVRTLEAEGKEKEREKRRTLSRFVHARKDIDLCAKGLGVLDRFDEDLPPLKITRSVRYQHINPVLEKRYGRT